MRSSTKLSPRALRKTRGVAILMVLGLLVMVSLIGASALRMFSIESNQTAVETVAYKLEQLSRIGLESSFTLLRSMGTTTALMGASQQVNSSSQTTNQDATNCSYFPRTDDLKLPTAISGDYADSNLISSGSVTCLTAQASHASLSPNQLARFSSTNNSDSYDTGSNLNTIANGTNDITFRSIFPWVRYRSQSVMDAQYGASENIQANLNQCGLMSQFKTQTSSSSQPLQRFRYEQKLDGLGETWINMGASTLNLYQSGLTLEGWVWMGNETNALRIWQRIFDIGRDQEDGNVVFAYNYNNKKLDFHIKGKGTCSNTTSSSPDRNCSQSEDGFFYLSSLIDVPYNAVVGNSLSEDSGNDLWYYVAAVAEPYSASGSKVKIYTKCQRTGGGDPNDSKCSQGTLISGSGNTGLYKRAEQNLNWTSTQNYSHFRTTWVGKSHWNDDDFRGKMRDLRVWDRALSESELNQPITVSVTADNSQSSIISNTNQNNSLRISPLYSFGSNRMLLFTAKEFGGVFDNSWRLVSCAWNTKVPKRVTQSIRFRAIGNNRPEVVEYLPY